MCISWVVGFCANRHIFCKKHSIFAQTFPTILLLSFIIQFIQLFIIDCCRRQSTDFQQSKHQCSSGFNWCLHSAPCVPRIFKRIYGFCSPQCRNGQNSIGPVDWYNSMLFASLSRPHMKLHFSSGARTFHSILFRNGFCGLFIGTIYCRQTAPLVTRSCQLIPNQMMCWPNVANWFVQNSEQLPVGTNFSDAVCVSFNVVATVELQTFLKQQHLLLLFSFANKCATRDLLYAPFIFSALSAIAFLRRSAHDLV